MNEHLQNILNIIQQSSNLKDEEKVALIKEANAADKAFATTAFKLERTEKIKYTTAVLLDETIEELELKRKAVEAQNKELEIEAALERVRSRSMAMQKSEELREVIQVVYDQFVHLNIHVEHTGFIMDYKERDDMHIWLADRHAVPFQVVIPYFDSAHWNSFNEAKEKGSDFFANTLSFEEKNKFYQDLFQHIAGVPKEAKDYYFSCAGLSISTVLLENVGLYIENFSGIPYSAEENKTLMRFGKVFQQTYTRFNDLKHAEAQAREAKIELSLERLRAKTMSMHNSADVGETAGVMVEELKKLGIETIRCGIGIMDKSGDMEVWTIKTNENDKTELVIGWLDMNMHPLLRGAFESWQNKFDAYSYELKDEDLLSYFNAINNYPGYPIRYDTSTLPKQIYHNEFLFTEGTLFAFSLQQLMDEQRTIFKRFAAVFGQTYRRYLDLKKAEAQAREAKIETALERVRSRSLAMHKSDELKDVVKVVFKNLEELEFAIDGAAFIATAIERTKDINIWIGDNHAEYPACFRTPFYDVPSIIDIWKARESGLDFYSRTYNTEEKNVWFQYAFKHTDYKNLPDPLKNWILGQEYLTQAFAIAKNSMIGLHYHVKKELTGNEIDILKRFSKVFDQSYIRFLDLQKAEAQARESQIQLALERVRARTMAMQKSDELSDAVYILFQQFKELGEKPDQATIGVINEDEKVIEYWVTMYGNQINKVFKFSIDEPNVTNKIYKAWKENKKSLMIDLSGDSLLEFMTYRAAKGGAAINPDEKRRIINVAFFSKGLLNVQSNEERSDESIRLLERFASVFEQTYTRFLDLQKAEAQAREAQIEAGLERVRYSAMAMQSSEDVGSATAVVFTEISTLGIEAMRCGITIIHSDMTADVWAATTTSEGKEMKGMGKINFSGHPMWVGLFDAWKNKDDNFSFALKGDDLRSYYKALASSPNYDSSYIQHQEFPEHFFYASLFDQGAVFTFSLLPHDDKKRNILKRFTAVFALTFRRYLDLQKAEAQAREAQIEAALERVRSRSMGMQKSEELCSVIQVIYEQLTQLNFVISNAGFLMDLRKTDDFNLWMADAYTDFPTKVHIPYIDHPQMNCFKDAKAKGLDFLTCHLTLEEKYSWFEYCFKQLDVPAQTQQMVFDHPGLATSAAILEDISLYLLNYSGIPYTEAENATLQRFAKVFEQTYIRFNDLKQAEAQALEAVKRASVDRVRAEIASMRTPNDLQRITPLIWSELKTLGVPFIRCGVFIMDEAQQKVQTLLSTPDGKAIATLHVPFDFNLPIIIHGVDHWRKQKMYTEHWDAVTFSKSWAALSSLRDTSIDLPQTERPPENLYLHLLPFLQGMLYVGNDTPLTDEELQLVQDLANAFSTAYARYEDFNKLESANIKIERTLVDLKQTQAQLVQSEKMASLGELTAGIAHEIQNPLNFVNNFSEVNKELLAELNEEIEKGNYKEAKTIAFDIAGNEEKIIHHGKRADSIVKGMLQHSRSSSGAKEPTDINALCDEYLRLAYHGLRAKDKSLSAGQAGFNATMKTGYDETIGKINIIPQDVGRAILNIITNAFYAVNEKKKIQSNDYEPTVSLHTRKRSDGIEIILADNGNGIPRKIVDKIFQPFFTTKPTGQGTGLGLSLAYDILKAHGGEIKVKTKENEGLPGEASAETGTEFTIHLPF